MKSLIRSWNKDSFEITWFSGTGAGGQHRNKHQNCVRIKDKETGIITIGQKHKERKRNLSEALEEMSHKLKEYHFPDIPKERSPVTEVIRTYNIPDNRVIDHSSNNKSSWDNYELDNDIVKRKLNNGI